MKTSIAYTFALACLLLICCVRFVPAQDFHMPSPHERANHEQQMEEDENLPPLDAKARTMLVIKVMFSMLALPALMFLIYRLMFGGGLFPEGFERISSRFSVIILFTLIAIFAEELYQTRIPLYLVPVVATISLASLWSNWLQKQYNLKLKDPEPGTWICPKCAAPNNEILVECHECGAHHDEPAAKDE